MIILIPVFRFYSRIDILFSSLFYTSGKGFLYENTLPSLIVFYGVEYMTISIIIISVILLITKGIFKWNILNIKIKSVIFIILSLAIGPWLIVNEILKTYIGRARPLSIEEFGGTLLFSPAFTDSNQCVFSCSFVSGHVAFGFFLMSFGLLATNPMTRNVLITIGFVFGVVISLSRIMDGKHFLSDTIFAFFFVYLISKLIYEFMYNKTYTIK